MHLPGKITYKEIDEMITTVDKGRRHKNIWEGGSEEGHFSYLLNFLASKLTVTYRKGETDFHRIWKLQKSFFDAFPIRTRIGKFHIPSLG